MSLDRILERAQAGRLRPTDLDGLRFSLKPGFTGILCIEVVDGRATNLSRICIGVSNLSLVELRRTVRRFEPIDDV